MPIVQIITTGGTIAHKIDPATGAALPALSGEELVAEVPALADVAQVRARGDQEADHGGADRRRADGAGRRGR